MALDRDLAVAVVRGLPSSAASGWEATAATGVRGLRLVRETPAFERFVLTEANARSYEVLRANAAGVPGVRAVWGDGRAPAVGAPFDYVDLDPYGSPLPYLPAGVAATRTGGVLAVTATDLPVLAGAQPAACRRRYGANPVRGRLGPEGAVRILLATIAREAAAQGRGVRPLLGYVGGHHVRAYVRLSESAADPGSVGPIRPGAFHGPPLGDAPEYGPMWLGALIDTGFAERLTTVPTAARPRELGPLIAVLREEAAIAVPFYYEANELAGRLGLASPPSRSGLLEALRRAGYRAARTHVRPEGIRTDAPRPIVDDAARTVGAG